MNEKEFLDKLNNPKNKFGTFTYSEVCKLFSNSIACYHKKIIIRKTKKGKIKRDMER